MDWLWIATGLLTALAAPSPYLQTLLSPGSRRTAPPIRPRSSPPAACAPRTVRRAAFSCFPVVAPLLASWRSSPPVSCAPRTVGRAAFPYFPVAPSALLASWRPSDIPNFFTEPVAETKHPALELLQRRWRDATGPARARAATCAPGTF